METKAVVYDNWDDIVFENRNKAYGAYVLRKSYDKQIMLGFGITMALLAILLMYATSHEATPSVPPIVIDGGFIDVEPEPKIIPIKRDPPERQTQQQVVERANTPPVITTQPVEPIADAQPSEPIAPDAGGDGNGTAIDDGLSAAGGGEEAIAPANTIVDVFVVKPEYEGGEKALYEFIRKKIKYPRSAKALGIDGTVYVSFIVRPDGSVSDVNVLRGFHPDCDKEASRVISMLPGWRGAMQAGYPVSVRMVLPIKFALQD